MVIKTIIPKLGETHQYLGKPIKNDKNIRIGSITDVKVMDDTYILFMSIDTNSCINNATMEKEECNVEGFIERLNKETIWSSKRISEIVNWLAEVGNLESAIEIYDNHGIKGFVFFVQQLQDIKSL